MINKIKSAYLLLGAVVVISVIFALDNIWNDTDPPKNRSVFSPDPSITVDTILETNQTIIGQPLLSYSKEKPQITTKIITIPKGADTGYHEHDEILIGYVLEGEITVFYGDHNRIYSKGDSLVEAIGVTHLGENTGNVDAKILVVTLN